MKRLLVALMMAAALALPFGAVAQEEVDNPFNLSFELSENVTLDVGFNDVTPVLFVSTETSENSEISLGVLVDVITLEIQESGDEPVLIGLLKETDPAIGVASYHDAGGDTRAGIAATAKFSRPLQWGFKTFAGLIVDEGPADSFGEMFETRAGLAYTGKVAMGNYSMSDWQMDAVFSVGLIINFPVRQTNPESAV